MKIITVPGILSYGEKNTDLAGLELRERGYNVLNLHQPKRHVWDVRSKKKLTADVDQIVAVSSPGDILLAHSYGGLKALHAAKQVRYAALYLVRPAAPRSWKLENSSTRVVCYHSWGDLMVWSGGILRFKHPFGWAGTLGLKSPYANNVRLKGRHNVDFSGRRFTKLIDGIDLDIQAWCT